VPAAPARRGGALRSLGIVEPGDELALEVRRRTSLIHLLVSEPNVDPFFPH
jgi:hypothetical protein